MEGMSLVVLRHGWHGMWVVCNFLPSHPLGYSFEVKVFPIFPCNPCLSLLGRPGTGSPGVGLFRSSVASARKELGMDPSLTDCQLVERLPRECCQGRPSPRRSVQRPSGRRSVSRSRSAGDGTRTRTVVTHLRILRAQRMSFLLGFLDRW